MGGRWQCVCVRQESIQSSKLCGALRLCTTPDCPAAPHGLGPHPPTPPAKSSRWRLPPKPSLCADEGGVERKKGGRGEEGGCHSATDCNVASARTTASAFPHLPSPSANPHTTSPRAPRPHVPLSQRHAPHTCSMSMWPLAAIRSAPVTHRIRRRRQLGVEGDSPTYQTSMKHTTGDGSAKGDRQG